MTETSSSTNTYKDYLYIDENKPESEIYVYDGSKPILNNTYLSKDNRINYRITGLRPLLLTQISSENELFEALKRHHVSCNKNITNENRLLITVETPNEVPLFCYRFIEKDGIIRYSINSFADATGHTIVMHANKPIDIENYNCIDKMSKNDFIYYYFILPANIKNTLQEVNPSNS